MSVYTPDGEQIVIVGGGIAGLTAAWELRRKFPSDKVSVVERSSELGGLLTTYDYGSFGSFDCGMHWITETGIPEIDELYFDQLLPRQDLVFLEGAQRDLSGLFYRGKLQSNTQFPDLRDVDRGRYSAYLGDFFANLNQPNGSHAPDLLSHSRARFGTLIADTVIAPIAEKIHGLEAALLDPMARYFPLLDRVVLFDEPIFVDLMSSPELRARLAFPEQRRLPLSFSSGRRSYYPRRYGIKRVIDALTAKLREAGVEFLTSSQVLGLGYLNHAIQSIEIESRSAERRKLDKLKFLVWTGDIFPLANLLSLPLPNRPTPAKGTVVVSVLLKAPPRMSDLYCFFCADAPYSTYRITDFSAFCPEAPRNGGYPVSIELLVNRSGGDEIPAYETLAIQEIIAFGLIDSPSDVVFAKAEPLSSGFPSVSRKSIQAIETVRAMVDAENIENLVRGGVLARQNQFFQHDVLKNLHHQIECL